MNLIGKTIQCLCKAKGVTQNQMAQQTGVSFQAIFKWENDDKLPDIMMLPVIADYFGVRIDDLFQYKWNVMTSKEKLISFMYNRQLPDKRGRSICGYTPSDGDKIVIINDVINNGREANDRIEKPREQADVEIAAVRVLADIKNDFFRSETGKTWASPPVFPIKDSRPGRETPDGC